MTAATGKRTLTRLAAALLWLGAVALTVVSASAAGDSEKGGNETGKPLSNTLRWSTASEVDNFGFDVFRSTKEEGPFVAINEDPVPGAGTVDTPSNYVYVDDTIQAGQEYFYYVESISMSGERERMTPVFRAPPKGVEDNGAGDPE